MSYLFLGNLLQNSLTAQQIPYDASSTCIFAFWRHTTPWNWKKNTSVGVCFLLTDHRQEEVCWRLSSTNWAANPFLEIPHEWTCAKLRSTPPRQDKSSLKHIILFGWRLPSPTSVTSDCRIPTSDEYLRPILIDPEISIHLSYFCGKKRGNILMIGYCCCRKSPPALPVCLAKGCLVAVALFVLNVYFCSVLRLRIISMTDFESTSCYCRCCCCWCWCWCCCWFWWCFELFMLWWWGF